ncbi:unnamed protein product [Ectocarpus sp. CCAP 1310/34]|nr:unnamed protein product [Ectocarpus sp. CCAP 1310/34]
MEPKRQNAELERLRLACNVESTETITKAQEILRRMNTKCRPGTLGRGDLFRTCIAFDLACRALNCPVPHKTAVKLCGAPSEGVYVAALGTAQRLLGVQRRYTCREIAESVGDKSAGMKAAEELKRYKERFLASYPVRQVSSIDLDGTVYAVAAFYLCAKKLKHPVDKQRLLDLSLVREDEFMAVCRSMLDLCYSTLGVSVSDKPTAERLSRFQKAAALNSKNNGSSSAPSGVKDEQRPPESAAQGPARSANAASTGPQRRNGGGFAASGARRRIPLSGERDRLGATGSHVTALARSIQAATQRKRRGGMTVALLEPGGNNETNDSLNDRTHHRPATKRPRCPAEAAEAAAAAAAAPPAETAGGGPEQHDSAACSSATVPARCTDAAPPRPVVSTASQAGAVSATASGGGSVADNGPAPAVGSALRAPPATVHNPYAPKPCAAVCNPYAGGSGKGSGGRGRAGGDGSRREGSVGGTGPGEGGEGPRGDEEYTAWKQRVLASMENRMKETRVKTDADSSSPAAATAVPAFGGGGGGGAPDGGSESSQRDNAPVAAAIVPEDPSAPEAASPAAAVPAAPRNNSPEARAAATPRSSTKNKSKQPSLTSFFAPGGGGHDKDES